MHNKSLQPLLPWTIEAYDVTVISWKSWILLLIVPYRKSTASLSILKLTDSSFPYLLILFPATSFKHLQ